VAFLLALAFAGATRAFRGAALAFLAAFGFAGSASAE